MKTGLNREKNDVFYTKRDIAEQCCSVIKKLGFIKKRDLVVEPSAGDGAFIDYIKLLSDDYIFYDIEPKHPEIKKGDFLADDLGDLLENISEKDVHMIGNPPFGRQSSLAKKFIKKSSFSNSISFILPKSFKKDSLKKTFPLNFHLLYEMELPEFSFLVEGQSYDVPCVFQIWKKNHSKENRL